MYTVIELSLDAADDESVVARVFEDSHRAVLETLEISNRPQLEFVAHGCGQ